jgi:hypothetical protein
VRTFALSPKQMSYLKIYPKRIIATLDADGGFEGVFTLHIEQYGLQANDKKCDVKITQEGDQLANLGAATYWHRDTPVQAIH